MSSLNNKGAVELSAGFMVTLILAIVIFGLSISFLYHLFSGANSMKDEMLSKIESQNINLACGTSQVCIGPRKSITIERGEYQIFAIRILNVLKDPHYFTYKVDKNIEFNENTDKLQIQYLNITDELKSHEDKTYNIGVFVPKDMPSGQYILEVKTFRLDNPEGAGESYGENVREKIYIKVP